MGTISTNAAAQATRPKPPFIRSLFHAVAASAIALLLSEAPSGQATAALKLPPPTGRFPVGTTSWVVADHPRQVRVVAWYPRAAVREGFLAPYLREGIEEARAVAAFHRAAGVVELLQHVFTNSVLDAEPSRQPSFPVLVFSHSFRTIASAHTLLLEDLASNGYIVLSLVHPFEANAAAVLKEWAMEDATLATVTKSDDDMVQLQILRTYLSGLPLTHSVLRQRVGDMRAVVNQLPALDAATLAGRVAAKADLSRLAVFGHALGGITAGQFCMEDPRCRAGMNLDGSPQYGTMIDTPLNRPFLMVYSDRAGRALSNDPIYRRSSATYYRVEVRQTLTWDFTDMNFWPGPLRASGIFGPVAPASALAITRRIAREFFDQELAGRPSPLLSAKTKRQWEQVRLEVYRPSTR